MKGLNGKPSNCYRFAGNENFMYEYQGKKGADCR